MALGSLQALTAVGLVLIYRAARIINFAQVAMGGLAAAVAVIMVAGWDVAYPLAVLAGLIVAALTGAVVELTVVRRFWSSSRLVFTVATIGVGLILGSIQVALPSWVSDLGPTDTFTAPLEVITADGPDRHLRGSPDRPGRGADRAVSGSGCSLNAPGSAPVSGPWRTRPSERGCSGFRFDVCPWWSGCSRRRCRDSVRC